MSIANPHTHTIEQAAKVYLTLDANGHWAVDSTSNQGDALDGYDTGTDYDACECGLGDTDHAALALEPGLPTLPELLRLIISELYRTDLPNDLTDRFEVERWLDDHH